MKIDLQHWPINEDAESEFRFWLQELLASLGSGAAFALAAGLLIAVLPPGDSHPGREFARDFWPYVVECAFWLGMLAGLLWGGSKRVGMALAATLPWQAPHSDKEQRGRFFGPWAAFAACIAFFLWLAHHAAVAAGLPEVAALFAAFKPVETACWLSSGVFAAVALAGRPRRQPISGR